jgi:hypothetical protein
MEPTSYFYRFVISDNGSLQHHSISGIEIQEKLSVFLIGNFCL